MDLGISDLERPSTDYVKYGFLVYVDRSDYEGVGKCLSLHFYYLEAQLLFYGSL